MSPSTRPPGSPPETSDLSGRTLAGFTLLRRLGQGGMGQVYLAEQLSLKRKVALKLLRPELASSKEALERFQREALAVAQATHANIVQVYDVGQADGMPYMALEYVDGRNLKEYISKKGPPELLVAISIMRQVASALQRAGELGIVHRDIKPENILLTRKGEVKVADFGLARCLAQEGEGGNLTQPGLTMGTPLYMSPEQVENKELDARSDIYSFGVTCYHMLAGQPPFRGPTAFDVVLQHVKKPPQPLAELRPDLPELLCAIVHKMLAKDPAQRYQTAKDLLRDVVRLRESLSGSSPSVARPAIPVDFGPPAATSSVNTRTAPQLPVRRRSTWLVAAVVVSILAAGVAGAALARKRLGSGTRSGKGIEPADASVMESISLANKREKTLREAAEQYLDPLTGKQGDAGGLGVCMDLALFYLDEGRLNDADRLFTRLEQLRKPASYHRLGQLGRAIVLALKNNAKESNTLFNELFPLGSVRMYDRIIKPIKSVLDSPSWRYWIRRARWYNQQNGIPESDVAVYLKREFPLNAGTSGERR
jgi:serine/threonine protein kinase